MRYILNKYLKNLNRIKFVITNSCTGKCKHCSQGSHISNVPIYTHPVWLVSKSDDNAYNAKTKEILKSSIVLVLNSRMVILFFQAVTL